MTGPAAETARAISLARDALADGRNMMDALKAGAGLERAACIEIAYALQSGGYTAARAGPPASAYRGEVHEAVRTLLSRHECRSVLDLGAGEGTAWFGYDGALDHLCLLDLSLNRLGWAPANLHGAPVREITRVKGDIAAPPVAAHGFDAVTTMHALEPNGPTAAALVEAAASCAGRLLILFEPDYAGAHETMRARMERHGYAQDIVEAAQALEGFDLVEHRKLRHPVNPDNATSLIALARREPAPRPGGAPLADPLKRRALIQTPGGLTDADGDFVYPVLSGVACLAPGDGVLLARR